MVQAAIVKVCIGNPKTTRNEQVCAHLKSYRKYIFQNVFGAFIHVMNFSCAPVLHFFLWCQMAPQQTAKFWTTFFGEFFTSLRKVTSPIMHGYGRCFRHLLRGLDVHYNALNVSIDRWHHKICGSFPKRKKNWPQSCAKYFIWLLLR